MMPPRLIHRGWLRRNIEICLPDGPHLVVYDGTGFGFQQVVVDGLVIRKRSFLWFVPRFEFKLGGWPGLVEVRVWPWFLLRSLAVRVGDSIVYAEGLDVGARKPSGLSNEWAELA